MTTQTIRPETYAGGKATKSPHGLVVPGLGRTGPSIDSPPQGLGSRPLYARAEGLPKNPRGSVVPGVLLSGPNTTTTMKDFGQTLPFIRYTFLLSVL